MKAAKLLIQMFISFCLDYCNSLLYGVSDGLSQKLQSPPHVLLHLIVRSGTSILSWRQQHCH